LIYLSQILPDSLQPSSKNPIRKWLENTTWLESEWGAGKGVYLHKINSDEIFFARKK